jgi:hypothetical protein
VSVGLLVVWLVVCLLHVRFAQDSMRSHVNNRRAFICRIRVGNTQTTDSAQYASRLHSNRNQTSNQDDNYSILHITGYTKSWPPQTPNAQPMANDDQNQFCLIAIARIQVTSIPNDAMSASSVEFVARTNEDGIMTFVDQR